MINSTITITRTQQTATVNINGDVTLPVNTVAPTLSPSGSQVTGTVITLGNGTWTGTSPITYEYRWTRDNVVISGETANTYTILAGDDGTVIKGQVRATNAAGVSSYVTTSNQVDAQAAPSGIVATGGTITYAGGKTIHTFTSSGDFIVTSAPGGSTIDFLLVAGGGGGGVYFGAGGGAGGLITVNSESLSTGTLPVVIGSGGAASPNIAFRASNGNNSTFKGYTAVGGGGGGSGAGSESDGSNGGSGGGGAGTGAGGTGEVGPPRQGYNGIGGYGGSGGGAGGNADAGTGNAGIGVASSISGTSLFYAGGGGGATYTGGSGVGGNGSNGSNIGITAPTANTGSGGGGMWSDPNVLGAGAAGVLIISYPTV
jgi:hypothetical protein